MRTKRSIVGTRDVDDLDAAHGRPIIGAERELAGGQTPAATASVATPAGTMQKPS